MADRIARELRLRGEAWAAEAADVGGEANTHCLWLRALCPYGCAQVVVCALGSAVVWSPQAWIFAVALRCFADVGRYRRDQGGARCCDAEQAGA